MKKNSSIPYISPSEIDSYHRVKSAITYISPSEIDSYHKVTGLVTGYLSEKYTYVPSKDPAFPSEEGWEEIVYLTSREVS